MDSTGPTRLETNPMDSKPKEPTSSDAPAMVKQSTFGTVTIILVVLLVIALGFIGYVLSACFGGSCKNTCDISKTPSCPVGYVARCNTCSGHYYCGEVQCSQSADCIKNNPLAKKESRTFCALPTGETEGYCSQCTEDINCTKINPSMKCHKGWCSLCTLDSDCTKEIYAAKADGKCTNNVCVFDTGCTSGTYRKPSELLDPDIWPYNTKIYSTAAYNTCDLITQS